MTPVVIVGLGRIGAGTGVGNAVSNHLVAVQTVPNLAIAGLVERDPDARARVQSLYPELAANLVEDLAALPARTGELIVICTPASARLAMVEQALARRPCMIVVEKPMAGSIEEARRIVSAAAAANVELRVNFHRRFDPRHRRWQSAAPKQPRAIVMRYGKGLMNYGSHLIDWLLDWYGPIEAVQALSGQPSSDVLDPSISISFRCRMAAGFDAVAVGIDGLDYDQFEIDIMGQTESLSLTAGGADIRRHAAVKDLHYPGYSQLAEVDGERDVGRVGGFSELYAAIDLHLREGATLGGCDGVAALAGMAVLDAVRRSADAGGLILAPAPAATDASRHHYTGTH